MRHVRKKVNRKIISKSYLPIYGCPLGFTLVPKINTLLLHKIQKGRFHLLTPHQVLRETRSLVERITCRTILTSDHYTNYLNLAGRLPEESERLLDEIDQALSWDESHFRPYFIGDQ